MDTSLPGAFLFLVRSPCLETVSNHILPSIGVIDKTIRIATLSDMRIVFSTHAHDQMKERAILLSDISQTVQDPMVVIRQSANRFRAVGFLPRSKKKYVLVVVYDQSSSQREIVTAFVSSKIKKYL